LDPKILYLLQAAIVIEAKVIFFFFIMKEIPAITDQSASKKDFYEILLTQVESICEGQTFWVFFNRVFLLRQYLPLLVLLLKVTNLSNVSSVIYHGLMSLSHFQNKPINWCGFYLTDPKNDQQLILGPFQGKVNTYI
jgi:L-methionine (R)-S-oxide reductase